MATKHHTTAPSSALAAILVALAVGSVPVATLIALSAQMEAEMSATDNIAALKAAPLSCDISRHRTSALSQYSGIFVNECFLHRGLGQLL